MCKIFAYEGQIGVSSKGQAVATGLSEARKAGGKHPKK